MSERLPALRRLFAAWILLGLVACSTATTDSVTITDLKIRAPLPGSTTSVAYFTVHNHSDIDLVMTQVSSPQFKRAQIHQSKLDDGIMRMRRVEQILIPAAGNVELAPGGYHLMLLEPVVELEAGQPISLLIRYSDSRQLSVTARLGEGFE